MKYAKDMYPVCNDAEHGGLLVVYSARHRGFLARVVYFEGATPDFEKLIIAMKSAVNFPTELTLAGHHV